jgi:hypothetical protein
LLGLLKNNLKLKKMQDTTAAILGASGAGAVQIAETVGQVSPIVSGDTLTSCVISIAVGVVTMLINKLFTHWGKKKNNPKV